jgi:hypothetical protein
MTTPHERARAVLKTKLFLLRLSDDQDVAEAVRCEAQALLRHYPSGHDVAVMAELMPAAFEVRDEQAVAGDEWAYWVQVLTRALLASIAFGAGLWGLILLAAHYRNR